MSTTSIEMENPPSTAGYPTFDPEDAIMWLGCLVWCLAKNDGILRIPREELEQILRGNAQIYVEGDVKTDQWVLRLPRIQTGPVSPDSRARFIKKFGTSLAGRLDDV